MPEEPFYFTGGTLPLHASSYVVREADAELVSSLLRGEFCYVLNTRQMGKSSLMVRTAQELRRASAVVCVLDLTAVGQHLTLDQWYFGMLRRMAVGLGLLPELSAFWREHKELGPLQRWMEALQEVILPTLAAREIIGEPSRLVVFIDEIDAVKSLAFSTDEFFGGIRACYNRRAEDPLYARLTFCLLGVASPADLISDVRLSPFNIGSRILLADFTAREAAPLAAGLTFQSDPGGSIALLERVLYWTGGHPYMTQRLCLALTQAAEKGERRGATISRAQVDTLCAKLFLTKAARDTDPNLAFVRSRLLRSDCDLAALLDMYRRIRAGKKVRDDETDPLCVTLRLSGVVRERQGVLAVRNRIYDHVFDPAWVEAHMPGAELRRQKTAYRLGILRAACVSIAVLLVMTVLAVTAKIEAGRAVTATGAARRSLTLVTAKEAQVQRLNAALTQALAQQELTNGRLVSALANVTLQSTRAQKQTLLARRLTLVAQKETGRANAATLTATMATGVVQDQRKLSVQRQSDLNAAAGERLIEEGDAVGALPALTRALKLDRSVGDTARETAQRVQIAGVLARTPRLDHVWFAGEPVTGAAFSPDGSLIATEAAGGEVQVIDAGTGVGLWHTRRHSGGQKVAFSPDGRFLASAWLDGTVQVSDVRTGRPVVPLMRIALRGVPSDTCTPLWSPDSRRLAIYGGDQIAVWDLFPCKVRFTFQITDILVNHAAFSPDSRHLALACWHWRAIVLDADTGTLCSAIDRCWNAQRVDFMPDGKSLLTEGIDAQTYYVRAGMFDVRTGQPIRIFSAQWTNTCRLSPDGRQALIVSISRRGLGRAEGIRARVYSTRTGEPLSPFIALPTQVSDAQFSPDGSRVLFVCLDGSVSIRETASGAVSDPAIYHAGEVVTATFDPTARRLLTAGMDHTTRLWSLRPNRTPAWVYPNNAEMQATPLRQGSRVLLWSTGRQEAVLIDSLHHEPLLHVPASHVTRSAEGRMIGIVIRDTFRVYDTRTGRPLTPAHRLPANALQTELCSDGRHYWVLTAERAIQSFVTASGAAVAPPAYAGRVTRCVSSQDGNLLLTLGQRSLQGWHPITAKPLGALMVHGADMGAIWFIAERHLIVTRTHDGGVFLWDLRSGRLRAIIRLHDHERERTLHDLNLWTVKRITEEGETDAAASALSSRGRRALDELSPPPAGGSIPVPTLDANIPSFGTAFSADRTRFVPLEPFGGAPQGQGIHDSATGRLVVSLAQDQVITGAQFSRDMRHILMLRADGSVRLSDAKTGRPVWPAVSIGINFSNAEGRFSSWELSSDGKQLAAIDLGGSLQVWDLASGQPLLPGARSDMVWCCFTPDGRSLIAGTHSGIQRLDLTPDTRREADFDRLNALLCAQHTDAEGNRMEIGPAEVRKAWEGLHSRLLPAFGVPSQEQPDWTLDQQEQRHRSEALVMETELLATWQKRDRMRTALLVGQDNADSWFGLACDSAAHKQWEQTSLAAEALLRKAPDDPNAWYLHGVASLNLGQEERANQDFAQMIAHGGSNGAVREVCARVHREQGRWQEAAADYARLSADPDFRTRMIASRPEALLRLKAGDLIGYTTLCMRLSREAGQTANPGNLAELLEIASLGPSTPASLNVLATEAEKAYAANPEHADLRHAIGCMLYRAGRPAEAIARLAKAVSSESGEDAIHSLLFLAMAHHHLNHTQQAQTYLTEGRQRAEAYLRSTQDLSDTSQVWAPRLEMELLLTEATALIK
jgi:WD40 repeat protein/tetratricopeptide (TPR) repeat protein